MYQQSALRCERLSSVTRRARRPRRWSAGLDCAVYARLRYSLVKLNLFEFISDLRFIKTVRFSSLISKKTVRKNSINFRKKRNNVRPCLISRNTDRRDGLIGMRGKPQERQPSVVEPFGQSDVAETRFLTRLVFYDRAGIFSNRMAEITNGKDHRDMQKFDNLR